MPVCTVCRKVLPPIICSKTNDGLAYKCEFCRRESDTIGYETDGVQKSIKKKDVIKEYDVYLKKVAEENDMIRKIVKGEENV